MEIHNEIIHINKKMTNYPIEKGNIIQTYILQKKFLCELHITYDKI